ncbi:hypothetical protein F3N42_06680 [Marinihelvus fidelis]|uniref:Uncharacterized protein n=1 Tax=Marinihelvus fidelis TaxID=2613842 RepID=A0A5N0TF26_9GAMM|nr:hypothetical protein [Marinihelvus fidelis]KAA9131859.1 hypothetical protein F3N42_06680 [Marinihelvus fidelis]
MSANPNVVDAGSRLLALALWLVAFLGLFAAGSYYLAGHVKSELDGWVQPALLMLVLTGIHVALAVGVARQRPWVRWLVFVSMAMMALSVILDASRQQVLDLVAALWLLLAVVANLAVLAWLRFGGGRRAPAP